MPKLAFDIRDEFTINPTGPSFIRGSAYESKGFFDFLSPIIRNVYIITGIILFFFIIIGGLGMILSAGNSDKQKQSSKTLGSAVMGYLIMFVAYWLIKIIETLTGVQIVNF